MYMVKITEDKVESLAEHLEKGLRYIGKAMQCIDELRENKEKHIDDYEEEDYNRHHRSESRGRYRY